MNLMLIIIFHKDSMSQDPEEYVKLMQTVKFIMKKTHEEKMIHE